MTTFEELGLNEKTLKAIAEMGWTEPTPVQCEAIPLGMEGRDFIAQAQTGTGKTAAYVTVMMARTSSGLKKPTSLVLCPTRELALQVEQEIYKLTRYTKHRAVAIYGGASYRIQSDALARGADIVVGTPGRVKDLMEQGVLDLTHVREAVLDEADRMLEMGFEEEVNFIMGTIPAKRHTMLFSATMADRVKKLGGKFLDDPRELLVSKDEPCSDLVTQYYIPTSRSGKLERLMTILNSGRPKTIVFCQTKKMVDELLTEVSKDMNVDALHGDLPQTKRERVIRGFRNDKFRVLIATDVAARGLDVKNIECVVNYDVPPDSETYLHRIGRTGRAGREGVAFSFVTKMEDRRIRMYEAETGRPVTKIHIEDVPAIMADRPEPPPEEKPVRVPRDEYGNMKSSRPRRTRDDDDDRPARPRRARESDDDKPARPRRAVREDSEEKPARPRKTRGDEAPAKRRRETSESSETERPRRTRSYDDARPATKRKVVKVMESKSAEQRAGMIALKVNIGKDDGLSRTGLADLVKEAGVTTGHIGRIGLSGKESFIEVDKSHADIVIGSITGKVVSGKTVNVEMAPRKVACSEKHGKKKEGKSPQ